MQADPIAEWQRLTEHYREMSDEELGELACDFDDLTETAQQVLRSEMRSRGLGDRRLRIERKPESSGRRECVSAPGEQHAEIFRFCFARAALRSEPDAPEPDPESTARKRRRFPARVHVEDSALRVRNLQRHGNSAKL